MTNDFPGRQGVHALVHGEVQGVGFRHFVQQKASQLYLDGWVRNTYQGEVEVYAEGRLDLLKRLLEYLWQGPASAEVIQVDEKWLPAGDKEHGFQVLPTGYR